MDRRKCKCGREVSLLVEGATAYWCRDCEKLYPVKKKRKVKPKVEEEVKSEKVDSFTSDVDELLAIGMTLT